MSKNTCLSLSLLLLLPLQLLAADYYVSQTGSDSNPGTLSQPFATIQKAANTATAGDTIYLRAGVYRESVTFPNDGTSGAPIRLTNYNSERAVISGADPITGWTNESGMIYSATMNWDLDSNGDGRTSNQIFVNGKMMNEARWPNMPLDPSRPIYRDASDGGYDNSTNERWDDVDVPCWLIDEGLTELSGDWSGAIIHTEIGARWCATTGVVTGISGNRVDFTMNLEGMEALQPDGESGFYLLDHINALDTYGEWYHDESQNKLYLITPTGVDPSSLTVEAKKRDILVHLEGRSFIEISGIELFAGTLTTTADFQDSKTDFSNDAHNITLDGIKAYYNTHNKFLPGGSSYWSNGVNSTGLVLAGTGHKLINSEIAYSSGNGVAILGRDHLVDNNIIHDCNYSGNDTSNINCGFQNLVSYGHEITNNTVYNSGRSCILIRPLKQGNVSHNHIYNAMLQATDGGGIYCFGNDSENTVISYNLIQDIVCGGFGAAGIYMDRESEGFIMHHNMVWNSYQGLRLNSPRNQHVYNNTFMGLVQSIGGIRQRKRDLNNDGDTTDPGETQNIHWAIDNDNTGGNYIRNNIFTNIYEYRLAAHSNNLPNDDWQTTGWDSYTPGTTEDNSPTVPAPPSGYPTLSPGSPDYFMFTDIAAANFVPASGSPAIDAGTSASDNVTMPLNIMGITGSAPDAGAFEYGVPAWSAGASITPTAPNAPSDLSLASSTSTSITLQWQDNSSDEETFVIERSIDRVHYHIVGTVPANTTQWTDKSAQANKYYYRVRADDSGFTTTLTVTNGRSALSWTEAEGFDSYTGSITLATPGVHDLDTNDTLIFNNTSFEGNIDSMTLHISSGYSGDPADIGEWYYSEGYEGKLYFWIGVPNQPGSTLVAAVRPQAPYGYGLGTDQHFDLTGVPNISGDLYVTADGGIGNIDGWQFHSSDPQFTDPAAPTNASLSGTTLSWTDNSNNEAGFIIQESLDNLTWYEVHVTSADVTSYSAVAGRFYRIASYNVTGHSEYAYSLGDPSGTVTPNPNPGSGTIYAYEGFNGSTTSGTGWDGNGWDDGGAQWSGMSVGSNLPYGALPTEGGSGQTGYIANAKRGLASAINFDESEVWVSWVHRMDASAGSSSFIVNGGQSNSPLMEVTLSDNGSGGYAFSYYDGVNSKAWFKTSAAGSTNYLVLVRYADSGSTTTATVWVYSGGSYPADLTEADAVHSATIPSGDSTLHNIAFNAYNIPGGEVTNIDEVRVASSYDAVLGSPGSGSGYTDYMANYTFPASEDTATSDPDRDGLPNLVEYALGLDAMTYDSAGAITTALSASDVLSLTFAIDANKTDVRYVVEVATDLSFTSPTTLFDSDVDSYSTGSHTVMDNQGIAAGQKRFMRLRIETK